MGCSSGTTNSRPQVFLAPGLVAADIKSPSEFLGIPIGADRVLADYRQIKS
jgi:hypothetical protein